jgi:hypothetical protein
MPLDDRLKGVDMNQFKLPSIVMATLLSLPVAGLVYAQSEQWRQASEQKPELTISQKYNGTKPGTGNTLPKIEEIKNKDGAWITWPGFTMTETGGSRIFLQTTKSLKYKKKTTKKKIVITFTDTNIFLSNNSNPLVTTHFNTPVRKAYLKKRGKKKVELIVELKSKATADLTIVQTEVSDGYNYVFLDFAKGDFAKPTVTSPRPSFSGGGEARSADGQIEDAESPLTGN